LGADAGGREVRVDWSVTWFAPFLGQD